MSVDFGLANKACMDAFSQTGPGAVEAYTSTTAGLLATPPRGDFRNQAFEAETDADVAVRTRELMLGVLLADFPVGVKPDQDDTLVISTVNYVVIDVDDNGEGHAWLRLQKVSPP